MKSNYEVARKYHSTLNYPHTNLEAISNELLLECKQCSVGSRLSKGLRDKMIRWVEWHRAHPHKIAWTVAECVCVCVCVCCDFNRSRPNRFYLALSLYIFRYSLTRDARRDVVKKVRDGCAALFVVCKRGNVTIAEFLINECEADIEQRGMFENPEDQSVHCVTALWSAAVSGKLHVVKFLVRLGADINALSDTGSTPVRSACFMTNLEVVQYLVENGADIQKSNFNGGTCLINSVQSVELCSYLISKGADVNAKDIQSKTALHYAIQEHRYVLHNDTFGLSVCRAIGSMSFWCA